MSKDKFSFLDYTGIVKYDNCLYSFNMTKKVGNKKKEKFVEKTIISSTYTQVCEPTIDNTFKSIFNNKTILIRFLNDLLFPSKDKIKDIKYTTNDYLGPNGLKYSLGSKRIDLGVICEFFTKEDKILSQAIHKEEEDTYMDIEINDNDNNNINKNNKINMNTMNTEEVDLVIDVEMQKDADEKDSERFIKYVNYLDAFIYTKKVWLIALIFKNRSNDSKNKNNSSKISYKKLIF